MNYNKSKFITLGTKQSHNKISNMQRKFPIYGQVVERFEITRDLGLLIDSELKYTENVKVALTERHMKEVTECY